MAGKPRTLVAYCYASGHIAFGPRVPTGGLPICKGNAAAVKDLIEGTARRGWAARPGGVEPLLVPGIPEAENQSAALDALRAYTAWLADPPKPGVEFLHSQHADGETATERTKQAQASALEKTAPMKQPGDGD